MKFDSKMVGFKKARFLAKFCWWMTVGQKFGIISENTFYYGSICWEEGLDCMWLRRAKIETILQCFALGNCSGVLPFSN